VPLLDRESKIQLPLGFALIDRLKGQIKPHPDIKHGDYSSEFLSY
jgi:hypothetical protein